MLREIGSAVREKRVSPVELVEVALARIEACNADVNAVVALRGEEALAEARSHSGDGPLAGVPYLVKDLEDLSGLPTTFGSRLHAGDPVAVADDTIGAKLRAAGAIPIGKTNTPEFAYISYTTNGVFGTTRNPWNLDMSPGGSSGGASAALAAGMVPLVTSSDGGGSVRIPASQCGLVGYKPTFGAYGRGRVPAWMTFSMNGSLGARLDDVLLEASIVSGPVAGDLWSLPQPPPLDPVRPRRIVAAVAPKGPVDPAVAEAFEASISHLSDACGLPVDRIDALWDEDMGLHWLTIASAELAHTIQWAVDAGREDELDPGLNLFRTMGTYVDLPAYLTAQQKRFEAARHLDAILGDDATVLLTPTTNTPCWPAAGPMPTSIDGVDVSPLANLNTMELNFTTHPAVAVPMGIGPEDVPLSLQVVASRGRDALALGLAALLEETRPWPLTAPGYDPFPSEF